MSKNRKIIYIFFVAFVCILTIWLYFYSPSKSDKKVTYMCADNNLIEATFFDNRVNLKLPTNKSITLYGEGVKYTRGDVVFWVKDESAMYEDGEGLVYFDCTFGQPKNDNIETQIDDMSEGPEVEIVPKKM